MSDVANRHPMMAHVVALKEPLLSFSLAMLFMWALSGQPSATENALEPQALPPAPAAIVSRPQDVSPAPPPPPDDNVWLEYRIRKNDTMSDILRETHAKDNMRQLLLTASLETHRYLQRDALVYYKKDDKDKLSSLLYKTRPTLYLTAGYDVASGEPWVREATPALTARRRQSGGRVESGSSLFATADAVGMTDAAISRLIDALETQIDFHRDQRLGDSFRVVYDEWVDEYGDPGQRVDILAFEHVSVKRKRTIRGVRNAEQGGYYAPDGASLQRAFLPAPLKYRRVSSKFTRNRFHPVLKKWRPHRGVDYAARSGTAVRATADGVISKATRERGYGNVIMIKHFKIYTTVYAHLRGFAKGMRRGRRVSQGDVIGYVGQTGLATGPHLHYEFRIRGKHKDPLSVDLPRQLPPLQGEALVAFQTTAAPLLAALDDVVLP